MRRFDVITEKFQADEFPHDDRVYEGLMVGMSTSRISLPRTVRVRQDHHCILMRSVTSSLTMCVALDSHHASQGYFTVQYETKLARMWYLSA